MRDAVLGGEPENACNIVELMNAATVFRISKSFLLSVACRMEYAKDIVLGRTDRVHHRIMP